MNNRTVEIDGLRNKSQEILTQITTSTFLESHHYLSIIFASALQRSNALLRASKHLIEDRNYIALSIFPRMQLDTAIRLYGLSLVENPNMYIDALKKGTQPNAELQQQFIKKGKKNYSDVRANEELFRNKNFAQHKDLYKKYCGHVHFSLHSTYAEQTDSLDNRSLMLSINELAHGKSADDFHGLCEDLKNSTLVLYNVITAFTSGAISEKVENDNP
jgi:hypothetical protein